MDIIVIVYSDASERSDNKRRSVFVQCFAVLMWIGVMRVSVYTGEMEAGEDVEPDVRIQEQHQQVSEQVIRIVERIVYYKCNGLFTGSRGWL